MHPPNITRSIVGLLSATLVLLLVGAEANAGKNGSDSATTKDEKSKDGKFYDHETYARCDIRKLSVKGKRGDLIVGAQFAGKNPYKGSTVIDSIYVNTKGSGGSDPEFRSSSYEGEQIYEFKSGKETGSEVASSKVTNKGKGQQVVLPLKAFGKKRGKFGVQIQTCGEGAVDIAPGKDYFNDDNYDGTIKFSYLNIKV